MPRGGFLWGLGKDSAQRLLGLLPVAGLLLLGGESKQLAEIVHGQAAQSAFETATLGVCATRTQRVSAWARITIIEPITNAVKPILSKP